MSKADELKAKAARINARTQAAREATPTHEPATSVPAPLAKPIRSTVDLPPELHRKLQDWLNESARVLGRSRLTKQQVMVALVERLLIDAELERQVRTDLRNTP